MKYTIKTLTPGVAVMLGTRLRQEGITTEIIHGGLVANCHTIAQDRFLHERVKAQKLTIHDGEVKLPDWEKKPI